VVLIGLNKETGGLPDIDLDEERRVQLTCLTAIESGIVKSAHDLAEGGLAVALAECSVLSGKGALISLSDKINNGEMLFGEGQSRILITVAPENVFSLSDVAMLYQTNCAIIGKVGGRRLVVLKGRKKLLDQPVAKLSKKYYTALPDLLKRRK